MMILINRQSPFFDRKRAKEAFERNKEALDDVNGFDALADTDDFYNVYEKGKYVGSILVYLDETGVYNVAGWAERHFHRQVIEALKQMRLKFGALVARTRHKTAAVALARAGFKKVNNNRWEAK